MANENGDEIMWHRTLPVGFPLIVVLLGALVPDAVAAQLPRVRVITTGGTISNSPGGRLSPAELVASVPYLDELVETETEEFANVSSNALTLDQWLQLSRRINSVFSDDPELAGVVLTSGTDTLEELAFFLHLTVRHERPVVVVGLDAPAGGRWDTTVRPISCRRSGWPVTPLRGDAGSWLS